MINLEDFLKLDIRVGEILEARKIQGTDRLLKLRVDLGKEEKEIVSGIAEYFNAPEELVGKQIPILANLSPRTIKGHKSDGMILAVLGDGKFSLLAAENKIPNGSPVR
ncbi:methionine--tRNA ligase subunit beta [Candidatus Campbellbacteria bacterium CG11_big_fil_rev_8_21_14_0_20_44_21]|uniref:Methionine--tRNA ligase n=1 Tax=Candidatus Campbellbacteria bacterium CG22_combo_CG10-13_8_21_14_all_43_18 TaxID=1974530 RepID=A0A2H0DWT9_9BACT|nr:MAG: methionine--tRNA ligase subunit beta [Candidatus Campbellbacteria bacterium CG22_combo_CG10-13_8_21_14_all_43_18]PIR24548.1 MAG: methionine--tRNA ligase subunit beta [Candidatus Campbellbacteria bacterium CG11_big_fil_rev_8_21_14_0_20_44_21]